MDHCLKIPALALLGLSFTDCGGHDSIVGDWRAIEVNGQKAPFAWSDSLYGEELHVGADLAGEIVLYEEAEEDGEWYRTELIIDVVVDASSAPQFRIDASYDPFDEDGAMTFRCDLDDDTLTCVREDAEKLKNWVFARVE